MSAADRAPPRARPATASWVILLGGLLASIALGLWVHHTERQKAQSEFERFAQRTEREVLQRFSVTAYGLKGTAAALAASRDVGLSMSRGQFRSFVQARGIERDFPGVRGFGFIQRVASDGLERFIAVERADGAPDFAVRQLDDRQHPDLYVIKFIEPLARNAQALGLDVGSEARRRRAIERAVDEAQVSITEPILLVQDGQRTPGFLIYVPVYRTATADSVRELRRPSLLGVVYAPVVARELLAGLVDPAREPVDFDLFAGSGPQARTAANLVYDNQAGRARQGSASAAAAAPREHAFSTLREVRIFDQPFTLLLHSTPQFDAALGGWQPWAAAAMSLLLTLMLARLAHQAATGRARAEALAASLTLDLDRLAMVARRTTDAVVITDAARRITWANAGFERITGYTLQEAIGCSPGRLLQFEGTDPATVAALRAALDAGESFRGELLNRAKDGRVYWIALEIQPIRGAGGSLQGFMAIEADIHVRKTQERELARQRTRLEQIIEGTSVGTWEWNVETGETVFNERWARIVGHTLDELGPTTIDTWARLAHPDDLSRSAVLLERHFNGELPAYECEARMRHKDGHWVWVLDRGKLFGRSEDGRPRWMAGTHMDITERKTAESALRASEDFLDRTGRVGGVGGWQMDVATRQLQWTDQACRIHDVEPGHPPALDDAIAFYAAQARPLISAAIGQAIEHGDAFDLELPLITASGREIWVRTVGEVELVHGRAVRLIGAFQDVTQRRRLEDTLRQRNEVMSSILENLPCGLSVFDQNLELVASNRQYRELLDFPDALFTSATPRFESFIRYNAERGEYGPGDVEQTVRQIVERARQPAVSHQFERVRPGGVPLEIRGAPMPGGGFVTTYTDISARRAAEAEIQRSAALLRGAIDAIDEAFVLYDPDDRLVFCNEKYRQVYPKAAHLMVPGNTFEQIIRPGAESGEYVEAVGRVEAWIAERMAQHLSGNVTLVQKLDTGRTLRIVERKMPDGHIVGFRIDITEQARAVEAAQAASLAKSQFLANMSHEIRTPMNAILGMLALLRRTEMSPRQADYAAKTEGAARSLLGLLNDILDFSKVEAGKLTLDPHPFEIDALMSDLSVIFAASVGAKPVEVLFDIDPQLPPRLVGDAMRLQQVLINLGGNAIKFTAQGEVVVALRLCRRDAQGVRVAVEVRDTGIGIAPEHHARIFGGFTQAEASTTRRYGGTGLGVAISQRIVAQMGGELRVDSALGAGTRFHFEIELPVADDDAAASQRPRRRVLMVDDNPIAREALQRTAQARGWAVEVADSGAAALQKYSAARAAGRPFDVAFVDWVMPGMDGWQTVRELRRLDGDDRHMALVMVTAQGREELLQRSDVDQALIDGFVVKPVTAGMLEGALALRENAALGAATVATRRLAGVRLLLVEDNPNNQQVARELLCDEGASVEVADNGLAALQALRDPGAAFDLVLMDLQMPVMDGLEATRRLRALPGLATLPVVAMTANAMPADRDACLQAGMNAHVGKPFDLAQLVEVILCQLGRGPAPRPVAAPDGASATAAALHVSGVDAGAVAAAHVAGVDLGAALARMGGRRAIYLRMLRQFLVDLQDLPDALQREAAQDGYAAVLRVLHTFKGVAATLGAATLAGQFAAAERAAKDGPALPVALAMLQELLSPAGAALAALVVALEPAAPAPAPPVGSVDARVQLQRMAEMLGDSDLGAMELLTALQNAYGGAPPAWLSAIETALHQMDLDAARQQCEAALAGLPAVPPHAELAPA